MNLHDLVSPRNYRPPGDTHQVPMRLRRPASALLLSLVACSAWSSHEQAPPPTLPIVALPWVDVPADAVIAGVVRDHQAAAIPGAQVCAWHHAPAQLRQDDRTPRCATTGPDGAYAITGLVPAAYHVHASAPAFKPSDADEPRAVGAGERRGDVDLVLATGGAQLRGQVLDIDGAPIAGAWISNDVQDIDSERHATAGTHSDSAGQFALWLAPGPHVLTASAPGFTATAATHDAELAPRTITLGPAATITGTVVDAVTRAPIAGARIQAIHAGPTRTDVATVAYTDAVGVYALSRLPPGRYRLLAETGNRQGEGDRVVSLGLGQTARLPPLTLTSVPSVSGRVQGCRGGRFSTADRGALGEPIGVDGEVFLPAVAPGEYIPQIRCFGAFIREQPPAFVVAAEPLTDLRWNAEASPRAWQPDQGEWLQFPPGPVTVVRGIVVDSAGQPVAHANVGVRDEHSHEGDLAVGARTDARGGFALHDIHEGVHRISADRPNFTYMVRGLQDDGVPVRVTRDGVRDLRLTLPGTARPIRGRVVQAGAPIPGAVVTLKVEELPTDPNITPPPRSWGAHDELVRTDADGRFAFPTTFAGSRHSVWAYRLGGGGDGVRAHVDAGQDITFDLPQTASVAGTLAGPDPSAFAVLLIDAAGDTRERRLFRRTDGRWGFDDLPPGAYDLLLVSPGVCASARIDLAADEMRGDLELVPGKLGGLRGRLVDRDNHLPEAGVEVTARASDARLAELADGLGSVTAITDADGRFELLGLCAGPIAVSARTQLREASAETIIQAHQVSELSLVLSPTPQR